MAEDSTGPGGEYDGLSMSPTLVVVSVKKQVRLSLLMV